MYPIPSLLLRLSSGGLAWELRNPLIGSEIWLLGVVRPQRGSSPTATESTSPKKEERARSRRRQLSLEERALARGMFKMYQRGQVLRSMLMLGWVKRPVEVTVTLHPDGKISLSEPVYTHSGDAWDTRSLEEEWRKFYEGAKNELLTSSDSETESGRYDSGDSAE